MGWKVVKVEKAALDIIRGMLGLVFKLILFPDLIPKDLELTSFHIHFGDDPNTLIQIISKDEEDEIAIFV